MKNGTRRVVKKSTYTSNRESFTFVSPIRMCHYG